MNDLALCKRVAQIEGHYLCEEFDTCANGVLIGKGDGDLKHYNPLTDDALCFQLMVKYKIQFEPCQIYNDMFRAFSYGEYEIKILPKAHEKSPNKAICLAIIELHKEANNEN